MANPKHRHSKSRRDKRRTEKQKLMAPNLTACPQCQEVKQPHHACLSCGTYNGREILTVQQI